jgi:hypothetical protein
LTAELQALRDLVEAYCAPDEPARVQFERLVAGTAAADLTTPEKHVAFLTNLSDRQASEIDRLVLELNASRANHAVTQQQLTVAARERNSYRDRLEAARTHLVDNEDVRRVDNRERMRRKAATPEGAERMRQIASASGKRHRAENSARAKAKRASDPTKFRAREAVNKALKTGRLIKPRACERCSKPHAKLHGHHEDYSRPLDVAWLCPKCHKTRHAEINAAEVAA